MRIFALLCAATLVPACGSQKTLTEAPAPTVTIVVFGDSITAQAFVPAVTPSFADVSLGLRPDRLTTVVNWGASGYSTSIAIKIMGNIVRDHPEAGIVGIAFGTNDAYNNSISAATYEANLSAMVDTAKAAGKIVMIPTIPYSPKAELSGLPAFNAAIANVIAAKNCLAGPDLYQWFLSNPSEIGPDSIHPNATGQASINRLWAQAVSAVQ